MQHISEHIEEHYNGNKSVFARVQGVKRQHVQYWCKGDYYMNDDSLYHLTRRMQSVTKNERGQWIIRYTSLSTGETHETIASTLEEAIKLIERMD